MVMIWRGDASATDVWRILQVHFQPRLYQDCQLDGRHFDNQCGHAQRWSKTRTCQRAPPAVHGTLFHFPHTKWAVCFLMKNEKKVNEKWKANEIEKWKWLIKNDTSLSWKMKYGEKSVQVWYLSYKLIQWNWSSDGTGASHSADIQNSWHSLIFSWLADSFENEY